MMRKRSLWADTRGEFNYLGIGVGTVIAILILAWILFNKGSQKLERVVRRGGK